jgi:hypothetical protein
MRAAASHLISVFAEALRNARVGSYLTSASMGSDTREEELERLIVAVMDADAAEQSQAAAALWAQLNRWVPRWLLRTTSWPQWLSSAERTDIVGDACAYLVLRCSSRDTRVHQVVRKPGGWAFKVLRNYVRGQVRASRRRHDREHRSGDEAPEANCEPGRTRKLEEALVLLEGEIVAMARPRFATSMRQMFRSYVTHRLGVRAAEWTTSQRERKLLYLHRHRGKAAALKAYVSLQAKGLDPDVESAVRALLGARAA